MTDSAPTKTSEQDEPDYVIQTREWMDALTKRSTGHADMSRIYKKILRGRTADSAAMVGWLEAIAPVTADLPDLEPSRVLLVARWRSAASQEFLKIEADLRDACRARGWQIDGQWPDLYVERGILVHVDEKERVASVGHTRLRSATIAAIVKALVVQVSTLIPRTFSPGGFIAELVAAYDDVSNGRGGQQRMLDVYRVFVIRSQSPRFWRDAHTSAFTPIGVDQFRARMARALAAGATTGPDGRQLRLLPPLDPKDALFMHQPAEGRFAFVGRIEFVGGDTQGAGL
jgi:hypothetical protein